MTTTLIATPDPEPERIGLPKELTKVQELIVEVCEDIKNMLLSKNRKYGNAALDPSRIFSKASITEQLNVRLDDKLSRIRNQQEDDDEDAEWDLLGYLVLKRVALKFNAII